MLSFAKGYLREEDRPPIIKVIAIPANRRPIYNRKDCVTLLMQTADSGIARMANRRKIMPYAYSSALILSFLISKQRTPDSFLVYLGAANPSLITSMN